jgi:Asp-tRNA(Asn)/Glu-tRNA(Gln) amidotransferase A subunit family amidase
MKDKKDIIWMSALELAKAIKKGILSPVEVVVIFLKRIKAFDTKINAFTMLTEESAMREADACEKAVKAKRKLRPLHGVPVAIKDNIPIKGVRTTWGSKLFENYIPDQDMILVERLRRAGAIIIGKTNMPELGLIGITENPLFGVTRNPWDLNRTPGGSSGGSAAAVAAGMVPIAVGNDGGGSIRIPSSFCGVYGIKPQLGRVPRYPASTGWETLSSEGSITRTVSDAAMMSDIMAGPDERDYLSLPAQDVNFLDGLKGNLQKRKFAYSPDLGYKVVDPEVKSLIKKALVFFKRQGFEVKEVKLDLLDMEMDWINMIILETAATLENRMDEFKEVCYPPYADLLPMSDLLKPIDYVKALYKRKEL